MSKNILVFIVSFIFLQLVLGCSSVTTDGKNVKLEKSLWSDKDSEVMADSIVKDLLLSEWYANFASSRKPKIVIGAINDLTKRAIDTEQLSKNIERSFLNSGAVTFISSKPDLEIVRNERKSLNDFENDEALKKYFKPLKSDFFITGNVKLYADSQSVPNKYEYQLKLEVIKTTNLKSVSVASNSIIK